MFLSVARLCYAKAMSTRATTMAALAGWTFLGLACGGTSTPGPTVVADAATNDGPSARQYYANPCGSGDPVDCQFTNPVEVPDPSTKKCSELGIVEGQACTTENTRCVLVPARREADGGPGCRQSASYLTCLADKPTNVGGCPQSTAKVKKNIRYLGDAERAAVSRDILDLRIASYDYLRETDGPSPSIGFILEDAPAAPFVMAARSRVDMYSYVSSLVVTVQEQQKQIDELRRAVERADCQRGVSR